jgi:hypothetical protein
VASLPDRCERATPLSLLGGGGRVVGRPVVTPAVAVGWPGGSRPVPSRVVAHAVDGGLVTSGTTVPHSDVLCSPSHDGCEVALSVFLTGKPTKGVPEVVHCVVGIVIGRPRT